MNTKKLILKSSGEVEPFSSDKLLRSVANTGLDQECCKEIAEKVTQEVSKKVRKNTTSKEIFKHTMRLIKKRSTIAAIRYSLKKSLLQLGPTGYTFERFVAKYYEAQGYTAQVGVRVPGEFVMHEVDVIAQKENVSFFIECKFHNNSDRKNDIKTALYIKARWDDLKNAPEKHHITNYCIATNTAFSKDALTYAAGVGLELLGVNAPEKNSFLDQIKKLKFYPITSLVRLKKKYAKELLLQDIILCSELDGKKSTMQAIGMKDDEIQLVLSDIKKLIHT